MLRLILSSLPALLSTLTVLTVNPKLEGVNFAETSNLHVWRGATTYLLNDDQRYCICERGAQLILTVETHYSSLPNLLPILTVLTVNTESPGVSFAKASDTHAWRGATAYLPNYIKCYSVSEIRCAYLPLLCKRRLTCANIYHASFNIIMHAPRELRDHS